MQEATRNNKLLLFGVNILTLTLVSPRGALAPKNIEEKRNPMEDERKRMGYVSKSDPRQIVLFVSPIARGFPGLLRLCPLLS